MKTNIEKIEKSEIDQINLAAVKFDFAKDGKSLSNLSKKSIYKGMEGMTGEEKKKFRGKIRRDLDRYVSIILGKDRGNEERKRGISEFLSFYRENWIVTDFRIETFSEKKNENDIRDYRNLLNVVSQALGK